MNSEFGNMTRKRRKFYLSITNCGIPEGFKRLEAMSCSFMALQSIYPIKLTVT